MSLTLWKFEARQTVAASSYGVAFDGGAQSYIAAADYYWETLGSAGSSLRAALQTIIAAHSASSTVVIADDTGLMTITWGSGSHSLEWSSTAFRDVCGFAGNIASGAGPNTGTKQVKGLWLPNHPSFGLLGSINSLGRRVSHRKIVTSESGATWVRKLGERYEQAFKFRGLTVAKTFEQDEVRVNESYESFYVDYLESGSAFRAYKDRTDDTSSLLPDGTTRRDYVEVSESFAATRDRESYDPLWSLTIDAVARE